MKMIGGLICVAMLTAAGAARAEQAGTCATPFTAPAEAGMRLAIDSKSAGVDVVGTTAREIRVSCTLDDESRADEVQIHLRNKGASGGLEIRGGPSNNVRIKIEIPRQTHLSFRMPAGSIHVTDVLGDKSIDVHAGELVISGVTAQQYRTVDASVTIGEVRAQAFAAEKGGFFREIKRSFPEGLYRLEAHVMTGSIHLD